MPRIPDSIKSPRQIIGGNLHHLLSHARQLLDLQDRVRQVVPGEIYVAACDDGCLHLVTPSSALATRVKYNQRKLLAALRHAGENFARIKISVRPEFQRVRPPEPRPANPISPDNARHLASIAKYIEDEGLRKALVSLSNRTFRPKITQ